MTGEPCGSADLTEARQNWVMALLNIDMGSKQQSGDRSDSSASRETSPTEFTSVQSGSANVTGSGTPEPEDGELADVQSALGPQDASSLQSIVIEPDNPSAPVGQQQQFEAQGIYEGGFNQSETDALIWSSSDTALVSFDDRKKGLATLGNKTGQVIIFAQDPNSQKTGKTTLTIIPNKSEISQDEYDKGDAYRTGLSDGQHDDPEHRQSIADRQNPGLDQAYEDGFKEGKAAADKKWDDAGGGVDNMDPAKPPSDPRGLSPSEGLDAIGITGSIISILEAQGASMFAKGVVGTTIGAILLPIFAFKLGTDIAQKQEDYDQAINNFVNKFIAITVADALTRCRQLLKAVAAPAKAFNDRGKQATTTAYAQMHAELDAILRRFIVNSAGEKEYVAIHDAWVVKISKQWANFGTNPRFQG